MDSEIIIDVKNLSKSYRMYSTPAERLKELIHPFKKKYHREFWALNDVSFEVKKGECIGIIGRNGSGKSTLLQVLCGVLQPTSGTVRVNGRISALLELGAGFSPEFTGRDNVYMNGALMGISREEMDSRFDRIAAFADIGDFIEQPVKTYSSGMYVRLAFACAVNVEPEILIVDEALAVGDVKFQKKCYDRMNALKNSGATIILVSHAHETIKTFTSRAVLLDAGRSLHVGDSGDVVLKYLQLMFPEMGGQKRPSGSDRELPVGEKTDASNEQKTDAEQGYCLEVVPSKDDEAKSYGAGGARINWVKIYGLEKPNIFHGGERIRIKVSYSWDRNHLQKAMQEEGLEANLITGVPFENKQGVVLTGLVTTLMETQKVDINPLEGPGCTLNYEVKLPLLAAGDYFLSPGISLGRQENHIVIKKYTNLIHLNCIPKQKWIFGLMNWEPNIYKAEKERING